MRTLFLLILLTTCGLLMEAQETTNYVFIKEPTNVRSAPLLGLFPRNYIVRAVVSDINLPVIGRNFDGNLSCRGTFQHDNNLWLQVTVSGIEGWVKFCENDFVGDISVVPKTRPLNAENRLCANASRLLDDLGDMPSIVHTVGKTLEYRINVRERPDITSKRIELLTGDEVYVVGRTADNVWVKVTYNAMVATCSYRNFWERQQFTGWVATFLLDLPANWQEDIPIVDS